MSPANIRSQAIATFVALLVAVGLCVPVQGQSATFEQPPIDYLNAPVSDDVAILAARVATGEVELAYDAEHGYLPAVLEALDVPVSSQTLVFSKTSLQLHRISPRRPRALYFNDNVYVGWCQRGDVLELAATDAKQGAIFYTLDQSPDAPPTFVRDRGQCLTCHASSRTQDVPGYLVRSVIVDAAGNPLLGSGTYTTDNTSPFEQRWGGWYVTGTHGAMRHLGNQFSLDRSASAMPDMEPGANCTTLDGVVRTEPYLTEHSDLVALMVLEHQTQMHNAIAAANYETRSAIHQSFQMNELLERPEGFLSEIAERRIASMVERVVDRLLMKDDLALTSPIAGTSSFAEEFPQSGPRDAKGRSLRDLDLETRLFRYPCSYLIYSSAFAALDDEVRLPILIELGKRLSNDANGPGFEHLTPEVRREIVEILSETLPGFNTQS